MENKQDDLSNSRLDAQKKQSCGFLAIFMQCFLVNRPRMFDDWREEFRRPQKTQNKMALRKSALRF